MNSFKTVPIFFSADNKYTPYLIVALESLKQNRNADADYEIRVLYSNLSGWNISRLQKLSEQNFRVVCVAVTKEAEKLSVVQMNHLTVETLYRLLIPDLYLQYDKVLYLDCDLIVEKDVTELYEVELGDCLLGAVRSVLDEKMFDYIKSKVKIPCQDYFNAGVLVINTKKIREDKIASACLQLYAEQREQYAYADQDVLNILCHGKVKYLDGKWNYNWHYQMTEILPSYEEQYRKDGETPFIVHYTSDKKPWNYPGMPMAEKFWLYARQTICYEEILYGNILTQTNDLQKTSTDFFHIYTFPYEKVSAGSKIVLYGAGAVGTAFYRQMKITDYCNVVLWVDRNYEQLSVAGRRVESPSKVKEIEFDYLVIAVESEKQADQIRLYMQSELSGNGLEEKIVWRQPRVQKNT